MIPVLRATVDPTSSSAPVAPLLVLGPSLGTSTDLWDPNIAALASVYRVIRYDHRGQGRSPVPPGPYSIDDLGRDVVALMDRLEIDRATVAGVSLGGMVAMWLAAKCDDRVERLIAMCTSAHMSQAPWAERIDAVRGAGSTEPIADAVVDNWLTPGYAQQDPEVREWLRGMVLASPAEGYASCCEAIATMDLRDDISSIRRPTLVISATDDPSAPPEHQREIAKRIDGARLETVSDAAHLANVQQADTINGLMIDFRHE